MVMANGQLSLEATDVTATDAATTEDEVQMRATLEIRRPRPRWLR